MPAYTIKVSRRTVVVTEVHVAKAKTPGDAAARAMMDVRDNPEGFTWTIAEGQDRAAPYIDNQLSDIVETPDGRIEDSGLRG